MGVFFLGWFGTTGRHVSLLAGSLPPEILPGWERHENSYVYEDDDVGVSTVFFYFIFLCFGSCVSSCRRRRRRHSVSSLGPSRRALARSLLSTVTGDDKMMESMSNAVAILLVTGGAFREPSCRALLRSTFPRHSSTPARLYSTLLSLSIPTLPLNPLYNSAQQYYDDSFFSIYSFLFLFFYFYPFFLFYLIIFISFFGLPPRSLSVTRPVRSTLVKLFAAPVSTF